ncbi:MAG: hypothetical protein KJ621_04890 [Proteobacteria bacterium]|nr:hypothetical protein [Pseudomonadota bacterium]MBU1741691.1 hypothetical protein [Pseudomonadota bacterium]
MTDQSTGDNAPATPPSGPQSPPPGRSPTPDAPAAAGPKRKPFLPGKAPFVLPGLAWLGVAFGPWVVYWILGSLVPKWWWLNFPLAAVLGLVVLGYRFVYLKITWWDVATPAYFGLVFILCLLGPSGRNFLFIPFGDVLSYLVLAGVWLATLTRPQPLTLSYVQNGPGAADRDEALGARVHVQTTAVWGLGFLLVAVLCLAANIPGHAVVWTLLRYLLLSLGALFTVFFLNWYPSFVARHRRRPPAEM